MHVPYSTAGLCRGFVESMRPDNQVPEVGAEVELELDLT